MFTIATYFLLSLRLSILYSHTIYFYYSWIFVSNDHSRWLVDVVHMLSPRQKRKCVNICFIYLNDQSVCVCVWCVMCKCDKSILPLGVSPIGNNHRNIFFFSFPYIIFSYAAWTCSVINKKNWKIFAVHMTRPSSEHWEDDEWVDIFQTKTKALYVKTQKKNKIVMPVIVHYIQMQ